MTDDKEITGRSKVLLKASFIWRCPACQTAFSIPEHELLVANEQCAMCGHHVEFTGFTPKIRLFTKEGTDTKAQAT